MSVAIPPMAIENHPADSRVELDESGTIQTLTSRMGTGGGNVPLVMDAGAVADEPESFKPKVYGICSDASNAMRSDNPHSGIYEATTTRTLDTNGGNPTCAQGGMAVVFAEGCVSPEDGVGYSNPQGTASEECASAPTPQTLKIRAGCPGGGKGALIQNDKSATLSCNNDQTLFVPTAYSIDRASYNQGKNAQFDISIQEEQAQTLVARGPHAVAQPQPLAFTQNQREEVRDLQDKAATLSAEPGTHQQTYVMQGNMIGRAEKNGPQGSGVSEGISFSLTTVDKHAVAYSMTTGSYTEFNEDVAATLMARDYKDPPIVSGAQYVIRRLIPLECLRLQGFPDFWCAGLGTAKPTKDEIEWWAGVFETHRRITGESSKPKTKRQIAKWLRKPNNDAAEYKMWGNGVALPCVSFVLAGIVWHLREPGGL